MFEKITDIRNIKQAYLDLKEKFYNPMNNQYELGRLARGVDGECFPIFQKGAGRKLVQIQREMLNFKMPLPSIDLKIPKSSNPSKFRTISLSSLKEKIKHQAICRVIEPVLEKMYADNLYSYRQRKGAYQAIKDFRKVMLSGKCPFYTYKVDMKDYFDNLDHEILLNLVQQTFRDKNLTRLIRVFIRQRRLDGNALEESEKGVVQGIAISAHMANLYLMELDQEMKTKKILYFRVGDDIIVLHNDKDELKKLSRYIENYLVEKRKLPINYEKTKTYSPDEAFEYLGYEIQNGNLKIAKRNCERMKAKIRIKLKKSGKKQPLEETMGLIFPAERIPDHVMWLRYFMLSDNDRQLREIDDFIEDRIRLACFGKKRNKNYTLMTLAQMRKYGYISLSQIYFDITRGRKSFKDYVRRFIQK